jgi:hypothetical protein
MRNELIKKIENIRTKDYKSISVDPHLLLTTWLSSKTVLDGAQRLELDVIIIFYDVNVERKRKEEENP